MKSFSFFVIILAAALILVSPALCQDQNKDMAKPQAVQSAAPATTPQAAPAAATETVSASAPAAAPAAATVTKPEGQDTSLYGEIKSIDSVNNTMAIQYYDYDSDEEKTATIAVDSNTKMENAKTISDIKQGDWADVTYSVVDGKNMAKNIIVEKEEATAIQPAATVDNGPDVPEEE